MADVHILRIFSFYRYPFSVCWEKHQVQLSFSYQNEPKPLQTPEPPLSKLTVNPKEPNSACFAVSSTLSRL